MRILYVENHARFAAVAMAQVLASHDVTLVPSVVDARQALADNTFDVVLVDYDLDDGKGDEVVMALRTQPLRCPFIIAVSSHQAGNAALTAAGADAVCSKMQFSMIENVIAGLVHNGG